MQSADLTSQVIDFLIFILPIAIPFFLLVVLFNMWVSFARRRFLNNQEYKLLKIVPPRDIFKTPIAMELFINALYQTFGEADIFQKYWEGSVRPWFSLEIASDGGALHFYIWTRKGSAGYIQSQIYAQYPGIEVVEVEDYATKVNYDSGKYKMWAIEYALTEPDPVPIKTYVDYGMDKSSEEEEKTDPITPTLEFMGSIRPGEHVWLQIIVRAHKKEDSDPTKWFGKTDRWVDEAKDLIKDIRDQSLVEFGHGGESQKAPLATKGQMDKITAIERSVSKLPFDVGIRGVYLAEKDLFDTANIGGLIGSFKQYSSTALNGFKPGITTKFDWWEDPTGKKLERMKKEILEAYVEREYFWKPLLGRYRKKFILNSEELATIFHFPGGVAHTPTLERVQSKKSEAPSDLPV